MPIPRCPPWLPNFRCRRSVTRTVRHRDAERQLGRRRLRHYEFNGNGVSAPEHPIGRHPPDRVRVPGDERVMPDPAHVVVHVPQFHRRRIQEIASLAVASLQPQLHADLARPPRDERRHSVVSLCAPSWRANEPAESSFDAPSWLQAASSHGRQCMHRVRRAAGTKPAGLHPRPSTFDGRTRASPCSWHVAVPT